MELTVDGKFKYRDDGYTQKLILKISFQLPNKMIKSRYKWTLAHSLWVNDEYESYEEFQQAALKYLQDEDLLKETVVDMINQYIDKKVTKDIRHVNEKSIIDLVKQRKFTVKVNIK